MPDTSPNDSGSRALLPTLPYRGTRDFLPPEMSIRQQVFGKLFEAVERFGFERYDGPLLESAEIYEAKSGREIADQQMYSLTDGGGRRLALRPEMTPSAARIVAGNRKSLQFPLRWYSHVNCHRYERPQRGRTREHWQLNVDIFGTDGIESEIEIFEVVHELMAALGAPRGSWVLRAGDRTILMSILQDVVGIPADNIAAAMSAVDRWEKVPHGALREELERSGVPGPTFDHLSEVLGEGSAVLERVPEQVQEMSRLARILRTSAGELVTFDPLIVRGLEYYTSTVFEVFDESPQNRRALFGGGRYENLTGLFTREAVPGIGFGMGDVTLFDFLETHELLPTSREGVDVAVLVVDPHLVLAGRAVAADLRAAGLKTWAPLEVRKLGKELTRMARKGTRHVVIVGAAEWEQGAVILRDLQRGEQVVARPEEIPTAIASAL
ncbi:histidine--tRNA ligase [Brachybacterium alimentarium]|uniref:histidine--tRNA ligase n=1 Tax=Brachybacterium alimentarium TaxID=47845 RepID=UPI003FD4EBA2